ncbi:MAG: Gfo/Idh/MocA family oxidoreductase [Candidatus Limnocylindrales bacterium]
MIIVDRLLAEREQAGNPVRVAMVGAGFMGQALANQIVNSVTGMRLVAISNRRPERAEAAYAYAGLETVERVASQQALEAAIAAGRPAVTDDEMLLARSGQVDILVDATGAVDFGARLALEAFAHGTDVVLMNAELDATIGPLLAVKAREAGVIMSAVEGDEPGVQMNLIRWARGLGLIPRVVGNVKGLQDRYRNPTTQEGFARKWGENPYMVTSFADGTKISFEQAIVANATGFGVLQRGMSRGGSTPAELSEIASLYDLEQLRQLGGVVDYTVGPAGVKIFVLAEHPDPKQRHYLDLYKLGSGPLYALTVPYHLVHFEVPNAIARVALLRDEVAPPLAGPVVEVCACAKRDLKAGETLDAYGGYTTYGEAVNTDEMRTQRYLPEGLVEGCVLVRDVPQDTVLTYDDVRLPAGRLADRLRAEQYLHFAGDTWLDELLSGQAAAA